MIGARISHEFVGKPLNSQPDKKEDEPQDHVFLVGFLLQTALGGRQGRVTQGTRMCPKLFIRPLVHAKSRVV